MEGPEEAAAEGASRGLAACRARLDPFLRALASSSREGGAAHLAPASAARPRGFSAGKCCFQRVSSNLNPCGASSSGCTSRMSCSCPPRSNRTCSAEGVSWHTAGLSPARNVVVEPRPVRAPAERRGGCTRSCPSPTRSFCHASWRAKYAAMGLDEQQQRRGAWGALSFTSRRVGRCWKGCGARADTTAPKYLARRDHGTRVHILPCLESFSGFHSRLIAGLYLHVRKSRRYHHSDTGVVQPCHRDAQPAVQRAAKEVREWPPHNRHGAHRMATAQGTWVTVRALSCRSISCWAAVRGWSVGRGGRQHKTARASVCSMSQH